MEKRFLIVGLGLLGGRYAMGLARAGFCVDGADTDPAAVAYALEKGYIRQGRCGDHADLARQADVVVLALYPAAQLEWAKTYGPVLKPGCLITDVAGVKRGIIEPVQQALGDTVEFIACHPMAGKEVSGIRNSHLVEFTPANFIITPTDRNTPEGIAFAKRLAAALGFAHVSVLTPEEHDRMIGYVSQLTHAIAVSLMCASDNGHLNEYTGDSFRDLTRIARINPTMWSELFLRNRDNLTAEIDQFTAALTQLRGYLEAGDAAGLEAMFRLSSQRRAAFDKKPEV